MLEMYSFPRTASCRLLGCLPMYNVTSRRLPKAAVVVVVVPAPPPPPVAAVTGRRIAPCSTHSARSVTAAYCPTSPPSTMSPVSKMTGSGSVAARSCVVYSPVALNADCSASLSCATHSGSWRLRCVVASVCVVQCWLLSEPVRRFNDTLRKGLAPQGRVKARIDASHHTRALPDTWYTQGILSACARAQLVADFLCMRDVRGLLCPAANHSHKRLRNTAHITTTIATRNCTPSCRPWRATMHYTRAACTHTHTHTPELV
jgi:hypothetical protein